MISRPPKVCHTSRNSPIFSNTCIHTYICLYREVCLSSRGFLSGEFCPGFFVCKVLFGVFLSVTLLSEYIRYNRKLNITFNFRFHMYKKIQKCDVTCSWTPPLSQTVTPTRTPPLKRDVLYGRPLKYITHLGTPDF